MKIKEKIGDIIGLFVASMFAGMVGLIIAAGVMSLMNEAVASDTPSNVVEKYYKNVYEVTDHIDRGRRTGLGTGVWIDEYHLITNCHVAQMFAVHTRMENLDGSLEALKTTFKPARAVSWDRTSNYEMEVLSCDMIYDLAVLRSKWPNHEAKKISIKWRPPTLGTEVFSAGYRMGLPLAPKVGYYGVRQTQLPKPRVGITIPVASGDSGSPVFTADGKLVALVSAVYGYSNYQGNVIPIANITMAIPGIIIKIFVEETIYDSQKGKGRSPITSPHS